MERNMRKERCLFIGKILLWITFILLSMFLCASLGYHMVRKSDSESKKAFDGSFYKSPYTMPQKSEAPFHLPTLHTETGENAVIPDGEEVYNLWVDNDKNDYALIAENDLVNLFLLTPDGKQVYLYTTDIALAALTPEDRMLLTDGIIVKSEAELASLLEDYTS